MNRGALGERLTQRQLEVLELLAKGLTNSEIASVLAIAPGTAKNHVSAVLAALEVSNRTEAVGLLQGLIDDEAPRAGPIPGFGARPAIAVLPFDDMSPDPDPAFADGLVEDLTTRLARWRWFPVIARNTCFARRARGAPVDVVEVSRELGARYVIEGSTRRVGDRVRVNVQLIDGEHGQHVCAERYDRAFEDVFAIQDELVETIVGALAPTLARVERLRAVRVPKPDLGAWECVQRGLHHYYQMTEPEIAEARKYFARALEIDPTCAPAHDGMALSYLADTMLGYGGGPAKTIPAALASARQAVELDPEDAMAQTALGSVLGLMRQGDEAVRALGRALDLDPSSALASFSLGLALLYPASAEEALGYFERALRLSPLDPMARDIRGGVATASFVCRRYEKAMEEARITITEERGVGFSYEPLIAASLTRLGRVDEAREAVKRLRERFPNASLEPARIFAADEVIDDLREALLEVGFDI